MSTVKKRGLQDRQYIGPVQSLAFEIGAMSVFVVVPHPEQAPRSRVSSGTGCAGCARLCSVTSFSLWPGLGVLAHPRGHLFI